MTLVTTPRGLAHTLRAALVLFLVAGAAQAQNDLVITGVVDGPLSGGTPKAVELYATGDIADLSLYAVGSANNGGGTDGPELVLSGSATAGEFIYVADDADQFNAFFGFVPDIDAPGFEVSINGDDAVELFYDDDGFGTGNPEGVVDTFGEIDVDGSGQPWEYQDGWAYRVDGTGPDGSTFVLDSWTFSGVDALDGETTNGTAAVPFPIGTYATGGGATPVVSFTEPGTTVTEGDVVTLTVQLDFPNDTPDGNPVTVDVVFDGMASTASPADFDGPTPTQLTFDGTTDEEQQSVTVSVISGDGDEGDETAVFDLAVASGEVDLGTPSAFTLTIEDSEAPAPARVQLIHNAADPLAELVDISIVPLEGGGDGTSFNDVPFRGATAFFDLAPGTYQVVVTDEEDLAVVLIDEEVSVTSGEAYQLIANGVVDTSAFEPNPSGQPIDATLFVVPGAREASSLPGFAQINAVHGITDAPAVDVGVQGIGVLVEDVIYGDVSDYADVPPGEYQLFITTADGETTLGQFYADLSGLGGAAATVLASGFLTPENDQDGPAAGALAVLPDGTSFLLPYSVSLDEARALPVGTPVFFEARVSRAMGDFTRVQDATGGITIRQTEGPFNADVADGTIGPGTVLQVAGTTSEFRQLLQINGDDLQSYEVLGTVAPPEPQLVTLAELAADGEDYESELIEVVNLIIDPDGDTVFQPATTYGITDPSLGDGSVVLRTPNAEDTAIDGEPIPTGLATFTGVLGQFDFDDPAAGYQLLPVQADDVAGQELVTVPVQFIHNAPDPAFATVDLYLDGELAVDDFAFRTATSFGDAPADVAFEAAIAPGDSEGPEDAFFTQTYTLPSGSAYQFIALGVGEGDFEPNPDGEDIAFTLVLNEGAQLDSDTDDTLSDLNFVHGTPDAPTIDVRIGETQDVILYNDVAYGGIAGYQPLAPEVEVLEVSSADGSTTFATFIVDLADRIDEAGTILASGFFTPDNEPGEAPDFGLLVVFADGTAQFVEPGLLPNTEDGVVPAAFALDGNYPNPFAGRTTLRYDLPADATVSVAVFDVLGRQVLDVTQEAVAAGVGRTVTLDAALPSGTYVYRLTAEMPGETQTATGRMTVVR
jgi:hypothetical protein